MGITYSTAAASPRRGVVWSIHWSRGAALGGVLAVAAVLRFALLGHNSIWFDEAYVVKVALSPWQAIPAVLRTAEFHPPLFYLLMKAWIGVAGLREAALRVPSACLSVLTVFLTYAVVRRVSSESVGLLSAGLVAVAPFSVMAGQDAKMYALLGALTLASTLLLADAAERGGTIRWGAYGLVTALVLYTHYLGFCVLLAHGLWVAGFQRSSLQGWLAAAAMVAVLYAPWTPWLWGQVTRAPVAGWGENISAQDLGQLLGLYAFGGSLLGMPSFFFKNTSLGPFDQCILLLPFVVIIWRGARAFAADTRGLALLGLPLITPIAVAFALSLARPFFEARWFSFLLPFYAAFLARGIVDLADHVTGRRAYAAAGLTIGLLLYSVPVFDHYYFDPRFRPYQWRQAAAAVGSRAKPGDLFVYGDEQSELPFTFYYGPTPAQVVLGPRFEASEIRGLAARHPRVWLIVAPPFTETKLAETLQVLSGNYKPVGRSAASGEFVFPIIYLLDAAPGPTR